MGAAALPGLEPQIPALSEPLIPRVGASASSPRTRGLREAETSLGDLEMPLGTEGVREWGMSLKDVVDFRSQCAFSRVQGPGRLPASPSPFEV